MHISYYIIYHIWKGEHCAGFGGPFLQTQHRHNATKINNLQVRFCRINRLPQPQEKVSHVRGEQQPAHQLEYCCPGTLQDKRAWEVVDW